MQQIYPGISLIVFIFTAAIKFWRLHIQAFSIFLEMICCNLCEKSCNFYIYFVCFLNLPFQSNYMLMIEAWEIRTPLPECSCHLKSLCPLDFSLERHSFIKFCVLSNSFQFSFFPFFLQYYNQSISYGLCLLYHVYPIFLWTMVYNHTGCGCIPLIFI